jgi:hypothetical protein
MHDFPFIFKNEGEDEYQNLMPNQIKEDQNSEQKIEEESVSKVDKKSKNSLQSSCCDKIDTLLRKKEQAFINSSIRLKEKKKSSYD